MQCRSSRGPQLLYPPQRSSSSHLAFPSPSCVREPCFGSLLRLQVLCLCEYPQLLDSPAAEQLFPPDVIARAREYLQEIPGGIGAYSDSAGSPTWQATDCLCVLE